MIHGVDEKDLISKKVITKADLAFLNNLKIPKYGAAELWYRKDAIDTKIIKAIEKGTVKTRLGAEKRKSGVYVISDDLGLHGLKNQVDGKMYDSKSNLRKSYKAHGVEEVGNDPIPDKPREQRGDYDCRADIARAMEQIGFDEKVKRR